MKQTVSKWLVCYEPSSCLEIPSEHGASTDGQKFEDDGCPGQNLVPEQTDEVEVTIMLFFL